MFPLPWGSAGRGLYFNHHARLPNTSPFRFLPFMAVPGFHMLSPTCYLLHSFFPSLSEGPSPLTKTRTRNSPRRNSTSSGRVEEGFPQRMSRPVCAEQTPIHVLHHHGWREAGDATEIGGGTSFLKPRIVCFGNAESKCYWLCTT